MKRFITILMILACVLSIRVVTFAADGAPAQNDILYIDDAPQTDTSITDDIPIYTDAPVVEDTYKEEPESNDTPRLADGEAGRGSIENPNKYWTENGYPNDVSFSYEAGGEVLSDGTSVSWWEIGTVNANDSRRQEIINMLSPNCIITFIDCKYSYNQREVAYNEIRTSGDDAVKAVVMSLNTEQVLVEVSEEYLKEYTTKFNQQYGSFVVVTDNLNSAKEDALPGGGLDKGNGLWSWPILAILFLGTASILFFNRTHLIPVMQTTKDTVITQTTPASRKETIAAVKNSEIAPNDEVFDSILRVIDKMAH